MNQLDLLVISTDDATGSWLAERLASSRFQVTSERPGPLLIAAVRRIRPHIAVVEAIDARTGAAQMEVALLKDQIPGVQIIAMSGNSSEFDAEVVAQGIFFYLAGRSREELLRVIEAAARERQESETCASYDVTS